MKGFDFRNEYYRTPEDRRRCWKEFLTALVFILMWPAAVIFGNLLIEGLK